MNGASDMGCQRPPPRRLLPAIPGIVASGVRQAVRWFRRRAGPRGLILLYHRVTHLDFDPQALCVSPGTFETHLAVLKRGFSPVSLQDMALSRRDRRLAHGRVAVTFDDGYADNLELAVPLLQKHGIPATVFVSSAGVESGDEFWWDELERLLLRPGSLPALLRLDVAGESHSWDLHSAVRVTGKEFEDLRAWTVLSSENPTPRHRAYRELCVILRSLNANTRAMALAQLRDQADSETPPRRPTHRVASREQLTGLLHPGPVHIGSHSRNHTRLGALPTDEQEREIRQDKETLEQWLGRAVTSFSYPFGSREDYSRQTVKVVRKAGFACACSNFPGPVWPYSNVFELPRFLVREWDDKTFERMLRQWLDA